MGYKGFIKECFYLLFSVSQGCFGVNYIAVFLLGVHFVIEGFYLGTAIPLIIHLILCLIVSLIEMIESAMAHGCYDGF